MKKQILSFAALLLALLLAGCAASAPQSGSAASASASASGAQPESAASGSADARAVTFTDALGRTVTVESPKRVAALIGSFADVWCLAGGKDTLVAAADDTWTQFELGLPETVVNLGGVKEPSAEALLAAQPDFVIGSAKTAADVDLLPTLERAGIPTAYFEVSTFEDYLAMLRSARASRGGRSCMSNTANRCARRWMRPWLARRERKGRPCCICGPRAAAAR